MRSWKRLLVFCLSAAAMCSAQINRATLTGIVTDPTGAVVPSVKIAAVHVETGTSSSTFLPSDWRLTWYSGPL
jgi:hypothetical protein